jgi:hypothetical protein
MYWRGWARFPFDARYWFIATAARRTDAAHRQLERAREGIERWKRDQAESAANGSTDPVGNPTEALRVLSDVELALFALHRALEMAVSVSGRWSVEVPVPAILTEKRDALKYLRDEYEHIDERALAVSDDDTHLFAATGYWGRTVVDEGEISYNGRSVGLYDEATALLIALRNYLCDVWIEMCEQENEGTTD